MESGRMTVTSKVWTEREGYRECDGRDWDRSALSGVPKQSSQHGYSHHHRLLRGRGGDHSPANLVLLLGSGSSSEHGWITTHPAEARALGYEVPTGRDPATVPIWRIDAFQTGHGWQLQTDDGQLLPCGPPTNEYSLEEIAVALERLEHIRIESRLAAVRHL